MAAWDSSLGPMCCGCWHEAGEHQIDNPKVRKLAGLIDSIDDFGHLHIIVDDWNLTDDNIDFCEKEVMGNTKEYATQRELGNELTFLELLRNMTIRERWSAFGMNGGCYKP